jgi:hypothetical protein
MTTSVDRADPDGTVAVQVTVVGSAITVGPVTKVASVGPVTMAEATMAVAAAVTAKNSQCR